MKPFCNPLSYDAPRYFCDLVFSLRAPLTHLRAELIGTGGGFGATSVMRRYVVLMVSLNGEADEAEGLATNFFHGELHGNWSQIFT